MEALKDKVNILLVQLLPDDNKEGEKVAKEIEDNLIAHIDEAERRRLSEAEEDIPSANAKEDSPITEDGKEEEEEEEEEDDDEKEGPSHPGNKDDEDDDDAINPDNFFLSARPPKMPRVSFREPLGERAPQNQEPPSTEKDKGKA